MNTFVALDSDGCVVDTMAAKQHGFLQPMMIEALGLRGEAAGLYRACADYVNLYSVTRGISRFKAILLNFETYNAHPRVRALGLPPLPTADLRAFVQSGLPLGNPGLDRWLADHPSEDLALIRRWSHAVNDAIVSSGTVFPAYEGARAALRLMHGRSETGIVSQSPEAVLREDWGRQGLLGYVSRVAGQEAGLKVKHAPGDLEAARAFGCRFFPILPGSEEASWKTFADAVYPAFAEGAYTPEAEAAHTEAFLRLLPDTPPWQA